MVKVQIGVQSVVICVPVLQVSTALYCREVSGPNDLMLAYQVTLCLLCVVPNNQNLLRASCGELRMVKCQKMNTMIAHACRC